MEVLKKPVAIGKSAIFYELDVSEMNLMKQAVKLLLPKKKKELQKLRDKYEGESDLWMRIQELNQIVNYLEHVINC